MGPLNSDKISRVSSYSRTKTLFTHTGLSPFIAYLSRYFWFLSFSHWPNPRSLAATSRVSFDILSSGYWDVSVHQVCFLYLCIQYKILQRSGLPHSEIHGSKGVGAYPWLIAACYVLHRLSMPRHPSYALRHLILKCAEKKFAFPYTFMKLIFSYLLSINLVGYIFTIYRNKLLTKIRKIFFGGPRKIWTSDLTLIKRAL